MENSMTILNKEDPMLLLTQKQQPIERKKIIYKKIYNINHHTPLLSCVNYQCSLYLLPIFFISVLLIQFILFSLNF